MKKKVLSCILGLGGVVCTYTIFKTIAEKKRSGDSKSKVTNITNRCNDNIAYVRGSFITDISNKLLNVVHSVDDLSNTVNEINSRLDDIIDSITEFVLEGGDPDEG